MAQESKTGLPVTTSEFKAPFATAITRYGVEGLNITDAIDFIKPNEMTRMVNVTHRVDGGVEPRPGLTDLCSGGTNHHTIRLLDGHGVYDPNTIHGVDTTVMVGQTGVLSQVDTGYSGEPLSMVPYHPVLNGVPWMYIGDPNQMSKVRADGLVLQVGMVPPGLIATTTLGTLNRTNIANFLTDGTAAASWTAVAGKSIPDSINGSVVATATPVVTGFFPGPGGGATPVNFGLGLPTGTPSGQGSAQDFWNLWGVAAGRNLSVVGTVDMTDDDYIHVWVRMQNTAAVKEIRIYFVVSASFDPTKLPGQAPASGGIVPNSDAYWVSIQPPDLSGALNALRLAPDAALSAAQQSAVDAQQALNNLPVGRSTLPQRIAIARANDAAQTAAGNIPVIATGPGSGTWNEYASVGLPLRRGDFQRIGATDGRDWSTITGIIVYAVGSKGTGLSNIGFQLADMYAMGGSGPDSGDATSTPYDYVYTHYDTLTGAESNPQPGVDAEDDLSNSVPIDALRRSIIVTPGESYNSTHVVQRFYRRGGTLPTDWFFVGQNTADGAAFTDTITDTEAVAAGSVETNNDMPVSTVSAAGVTILHQPLSSLWGPVENLLMGCGDPYRPGYIYFCKPGNPDSWPPENRTEVCSSSEQLLQGVMYGGQAYVFSQEQMYALYPNLSGDIVGVTSLVTQCKKGLVNGCRWGAAVGIGGIVFIANDGIYRTTGGPPEWLSKNIDPIFRGQTKNGLLPIDFDQPTKLRIEIYQNELYFLYRDTNDATQCLVYSLIYKFWRQYNSTKPISCMYAVEGSSNDVLQVGGGAGEGWTFTGVSDDGDPIACSMRGGAIFFDHPREEKRLGDQIVDMDSDGVAITLQNYYNYETVTPAAIVLPPSSERGRVISDSFGTTPVRVINISSQLSWSSATNTPNVFYLGTSHIIEPDLTKDRVTQWDDLGQGDEVYLTGITLDVDTGGEDKGVLFEVDYQGAISTAYTAIVNTDGRHKIRFSWPAVQANMVRIRPVDPDCKFWILYQAQWIYQPEPPRIAAWDSYFENGWDQYYTGLDLYCNTYGLNKTVEVYVDEVLVKTETVNTNGRLVHHITLPWGRGHVFHFIATDSNEGMLYGHRWQLQVEPSEQTNWNQNFTVEGTEAGKYLKAVVFQVDTFNQPKTVQVECDGVVVETLTVTANGRKVVQRSFPQHLGSVFRVYPIDDNPSRLYSVLWIFDNEPLFLDRWETQEIDFGMGGWSYPTYAHVTLRSTAAVNLEIIAYNQTGVSTTRNYTIPTTNGVKQKMFVPFMAVKGILFKLTLTSDDPFALYREETNMYVREWGTNRTANTHPFGNDDIMSRGMVNASLAAARGNYAASDS